MPKTITLSASSISTFMSCRRKYWFQYVEKMKPIRREIPLSLGAAVHAGLEFLFKSGSGVQMTRDAIHEAVTESYTQDELNDSGTEPDVAVELVSAFDRAVDWRSKWEFIRVEPKFEVPIGFGRRLIGYYDGIVRVNNALYVLEHKTVKGQVQERRLNHLLWDIQAGLYVASAWEMGIPVIGVLYNFLPKPTIEQATATPMEDRKYTKEKVDKQGNVTEPSRLYANMRETDETNAEYVARVKAWYDERLNQDFFRQHIITRNEAQVKSLLEQVKHLSKDMRACERDQSYYMNPSACQTLSCPFASVCLEDTPEAREANFTRRDPRAVSDESTVRALADL
jgi:hypothetical protein